MFCYLRFPFNWRTPFGYFIAYSIQCATAFTALCCFIPLLCFLFGSCYLFITFVEDITIDLCHFNATVSTKYSEKMLTKNFCNIIQLHSDVKELSNILDNRNELKVFHRNTIF